MSFTLLSITGAVLKIISTVLPVFLLWFAHTKGKAQAYLEQSAKNAEAQKKYAEIATEDDPSNAELAKMLDQGKF